MIDEKITKENAKLHIDEINQDILDTEKEIADMEREIEGFNLLGDKWSMIKADARISGIAKRQKFISQLINLLK